MKSRVRLDSFEGAEVVVCAGEEAARNEAKRRQAVEQQGLVWSSFRLDGEWVAKGFKPVPETPSSERRWRRIARAAASTIFDPAEWF